jgi:hypothetical protein
MRNEMDGCIFLKDEEAKMKVLDRGMCGIQKG